MDRLLQTFIRWAIYHIRSLDEPFNTDDVCSELHWFWCVSKTRQFSRTFASATSTSSRRYFIGWPIYYRRCSQVHCMDRLLQTFIRWTVYYRRPLDGPLTIHVHEMERLLQMFVRWTVWYRRSLDGPFTTGDVCSKLHQW